MVVLELYIECMHTFTLNSKCDAALYPCRQALRPRVPPLLPAALHPVLHIGRHASPYSQHQPHISYHSLGDALPFPTEAAAAPKFIRLFQLPSAQSSSLLGGMHCFLHERATFLKCENIHLCDDGSVAQLHILYSIYKYML